MKLIYFDNAATTPMDLMVVEKMSEVMKTVFGNASSVHSLGNIARDSIENSRLQIAELLNISTSELFFTSGATEAINTIIFGAVKALSVEHIISSKLEHAAVIEAIKEVQYENKIEVSNVNFDEKGQINLLHLKQLLSTPRKTLVCLMHVNNEIGNILPLTEVANICKENNALFFSDTVQSVGKYKKIPLSILDFAVASAHKFHGPKGVGFMYINSRNKIPPLLKGGHQERNMRSGTENLAGIVGMAEALQLAFDNIDKDAKYILDLKNLLVEKLSSEIPDLVFNGDKDGHYSILNIGLPKYHIIRW